MITGVVRNDGAFLSLLPERDKRVIIMTAITVHLNDEMAQELHRISVAQARTETDIVCEALAAYVQTVRPLPKGMGKYRSGQTNVSERARDLIREAAKEKQWP
jgi:transcriptional regulator of met regulon